MPTLPPDVAEFFRNLADFFGQGGQLVERGVYPLFGLRDNGTVVIIGSCFLLAIDDEILLISAAHVFNGAVKPRLLGAAMPGQNHSFEGRFVQFKGTLARSSDGLHGDDPFDVAAVRLHATTVETLRKVPVVQTHEIDLEIRRSDSCDDDFDPWTKYWVVGFPSSKTKPIVRGRSAEVGPLVGYHGYAATRAAYAAAHIEPLTHLAFPIIRDLCLYPDGRITTGVKLQGMSGGPVWRLKFSTTSDDIDAKLVGLATDHSLKFKCTIVTRMWIVLNFVRSAFADLGERLPRLTQFQEPVIFHGVTPTEPY